MFICVLERGEWLGEEGEEGGIRGGGGGKMARDWWEKGRRGGV